METTIEQPGAARPKAPVRLAQGLSLDAGAPEAACVWNVVAYEGEFNGHAMGAFRFSRATFEQIVANFQGDPRYRARAGMPPVGEASPEQIASGRYDVVQWDYHHASEMPPTEGNIAAAGAPACGWVLELKIGDYQGRCALLALSRFLEPARSQIRAGQYRWCSVSVWFNAPDPVSGQEKGATLTSIAVTNNPFLQGLPHLRASRSADELRTWIADAQTALATLTNDSQAGNAGHQQENTMNTNATGANSAKDAASPAAGALLVAGSDVRVTLAKMLAKRLNCAVDDVNDGHILAMANDYAKIGAEMEELMSELGAKTFAEALAKIGAAKGLEKKLQEALAGKQEAEEALSGYEGDMMEEDVGMALASLGIADESSAAKVRKALVAERGTTAQTIAAFRKTYDLEALFKAAREKLQTAARQVVADRAQGAPAHLTASIATDRQTPSATAQAEALTAHVDANGRIVLGAPRSQEASPAARAAGQVTLASLRKDYPHEPNDFLRKVAFVKASHAKNNPTAQPLDHDTACEHAHAMRLAG